VEGERVILVSQGQDSPDDRVDDPSVLRMLLDDIAKSFYQSRKLDVGLLIFLLALQRLTLFYQHV